MCSHVFLEFGWNFSSYAASHYRLPPGSYSKSSFGPKKAGPHNLWNSALLAKVRLIEEVLDEPANPVARSVHVVVNRKAR